MGRLVADPEVRYSQAETAKAVARYRLAVDRRRANADGTRDADFINCVAFDRQAEFAEKYLTKGTKICVSGRIQTGSYTNRDGQKVYTTDVIIEEQEFAESKVASQSTAKPTEPKKPKVEKPVVNEGFEPTDDEFMAMFDK